MDSALVECNDEAVEENHHANHEPLASDSCGEHHGSIVQWKRYQCDPRVHPIFPPLQEKYEFCWKTSCNPLAVPMKHAVLEDAGIYCTSSEFRNKNHIC